MSVDIKNFTYTPFSKAKYDEKEDLIEGPIMSSCVMDFYLKKDDTYDEIYLCKFANLLRQVILEYVPTYAFTRDSITITTNGSVYDNDVMKERLSQLPIMNINHSVNYLDKKYWKTTITDDNLNHPDDSFVIDAYVNVHNDDKKILNVTTDHLSVFINKKEIKNMYDSYDPILLIKLRHNEKFQCNMQGILGVPKKYENWCAASSVFYKYDKEKNNVTFTVSSYGQFDEITLLIKTCECIKLKMEIYHEYVNEVKNNTNSSTSDSFMFELSFADDNYTFTDFLNYIIQNMQDIEFSGIYKKSFLENNIFIKIISKSDDPFKPVHDAIDIVYNIYDEFQKKLSKLHI